MESLAGELPAGGVGFDSLVLRLGGEIGVKSRRVRSRYERAVRRHAEEALRQSLASYELSHAAGRIYVRADRVEQAVSRLTKIFGISSLSPALKTSFELEEIEKACLRIAEAFLLPNSTFAIRCVRVGNHPYRSIDVCRALGRAILSELPYKNLRVNLSNPDACMTVEVRGSEAYLSLETYEGPGGLPYGSQGRLVGVLNELASSSIACWLAMKRGSPIFPLYFDIQPFQGEETTDKALEATRALLSWAPTSERKVYIAPHGENLRSIEETCPRVFTCILCRMLMYRIAERLVETVGGDGMVGSESIGEPPAWNLGSLKVLDRAVSRCPIHRPLLTLSDIEVKRLAERIGAYRVSNHVKGCCTLAPPEFPLEADLDRVDEVEGSLEVAEMVDRSIASMELVHI